MSRRFVFFSISVAFGILAIAGVGLTLLGINDNLHSADLAVVLGNKVNPDGTPSIMLQARLDHAAALYHQSYFKVILVSGGHGKEGYDEPSVMRAVLQEAGVPRSAIYEDDKGTTTWETARNTRLFLHRHRLKSVLIISQYFHVPRCRLAFTKFGIQPIYWSHAPFWSIRDLYSIPREIAGLADYSLRQAPKGNESPAAR